MRNTHLEVFPEFGLPGELQRAGVYESMGLLLRGILCPTPGARASGHPTAVQRTEPYAPSGFDWLESVQIEKLGTQRGRWAVGSWAPAPHLWTRHWGPRSTLLLPSSSSPMVPSWACTQVSAAPGLAGIWLYLSKQQHIKGPTQLSEEATACPTTLSSTCEPQVVLGPSLGEAA